MKLSKMNVCVFAMFALLLTATYSSAAVCGNAFIRLVGPNLAFPGKTAIQVQCVDGMSGWTAGTKSISMSIHTDVADQVLATALTAISLGRNVYINATPGDLNGVITGLYILNI